MRKSYKIVFYKQLENSKTPTVNFWLNCESKGEALNRIVEQQAATAGIPLEAREIKEGAPDIELYASKKEKYIITASDKGYEVEKENYFESYKQDLITYAEALRILNIQARFVKRGDGVYLIPNGNVVGDKQNLASFRSGRATLGHIFIKKNKIPSIEEVVAEYGDQISEMTKTILLSEEGFKGQLPQNWWRVCAKYGIKPNKWICIAASVFKKPLKTYPLLDMNSSDFEAICQYMDTDGGIKVYRNNMCIYTTKEKIKEVNDLLSKIREIPEFRYIFKDELIIEGL